MLLHFTLSVQVKEWRQLNFTLFAAHIYTVSGPVWSSWRRISGSIRRSRGSRPNTHRWAASFRRWEETHCGSADVMGPLSPQSLVSDRVVLLQDEEPFNPDYVEVDRILDVSHSVDKDNGEVTLFRNLNIALPFVTYFLCLILFGMRISKVTLNLFFFFPPLECYLLFSEVVLTAVWRCHMGTEWGCGWGQGWGVQKNSEPATSTEENGKQLGYFNWRLCLSFLFAALSLFSI